MKLAYTLIELVITIALFMLLCSLALPSFDFLAGDRVHQQLERIEIVMKFLQQRAVASQQEQVLYFNTLTNSYYYIAGNRRVEYELPHNTIFGALPGVLGPPWQPDKPITSPVTFKAHQTVSGLFLCTMHPWWQISPGAVYVVDRLKSSMGALTCTVSRVSYIRRYRYTSNTWNLLSTQA